MAAVFIITITQRHKDLSQRFGTGCNMVSPIALQTSQGAFSSFFQIISLENQHRKNHAMRMDRIASTNMIE
jgi:hypothetical protein